MRTLILVAALIAAPNLASANSTDPVDAFRKSDAVKIEVATVVANGDVLETDAGAALLSGGCGFAGCDSRYLVTLGYSSKGSNPQTAVISAIVTVSTYAEPVVKLTSVEKLLK